MSKAAAVHDSSGVELIVPSDDIKIIDLPKDENPAFFIILAKSILERLSDDTIIDFIEKDSKRLEADLTILGEIKISVRGNHPSTLLKLLHEYNKTTTIKYCVQEGILDINQAVDETRGETLLYQAATKAQSEALLLEIKLLLELGANPNTQDKRGMTPFHHACDINRTESTDAIVAMIKHGADPFLTDKYGKHGLYYCSPFPNLVEALVLGYRERYHEEKSLPLRGLNGTLLTQLKEARTESSRQKEELTSLQQELSAQKEANGDLTAKSIAQQEKISSLEAQLLINEEALQKTVAALRDNVSKLKAEVFSLKPQITKTLVVDAQKLIAQVQKEIAPLISQKEAANTAELQSENLRLKLELAARESEMKAELESQLAAKEREMEKSLAAQKEAIKAQITAELEAVKASMKAELESQLATQGSDFDAKLKEAARQRDQATQNAAKYDSAKEKLDELLPLPHDLEVAKTDLEAIKEENSQLQQRLEELSWQCQALYAQGMQWQLSAQASHHHAMTVRQELAAAASERDRFAVGLVRATTKTPQRPPHPTMIPVHHPGMQIAMASPPNPMPGSHFHSPPPSYQHPQALPRSPQPAAMTHHPQTPSGHTHQTREMSARATSFQPHAARADAKPDPSVQPNKAKSAKGSTSNQHQ